MQQAVQMNEAAAAAAEAYSKAVAATQRAEDAIAEAVAERSAANAAMREARAAGCSARTLEQRHIYDLEDLEWRRERRLTPRRRVGAG